MISKERTDKIIMQLNNFSKEFNNIDVIVASYIFIRYGINTFTNEINDKKVNKIYEEIKERRTLFDEELNYKIDKILNEES